MVSNIITKGRKSISKEVGLGGDAEQEVSCRDTKSFESDDEKDLGQITGLATLPSTMPIEARISSSYSEPEDYRRQADGPNKKLTRCLSKLALTTKRPRIKSGASGPPSTVSSLHRLSMIALLIFVVLPAVSYNNSRQKMDLSGAEAGIIRKAPGVVLNKRADSFTDVCVRWAHQAAELNGTLYIYGGEAKTSGNQTENTWNNNFLTLDLTKSWAVSSPSISGLPQPSGPPAVALGYLWNDYNNLYLYGGEFADNPYEEPAAMSTWQYNIASSTWNEFSNPNTSAGNYSTDEGIAVQRAGEGAGISVPELGRSWYFGGHLDLATTQGWPSSVARVYLKSLLEFTHPGWANNGVQSLHASGAGDGGVYRNITDGGIQDADGFSERADGVLIFVPGWGPSGILLGLGGGTVKNSDTSDEFSSMSTIDVYDIETSTWYHQVTSGTAPNVRVNQCAVIFSAPDASSFNIYMYGGQNLLPVAGQTQYTDIWILTVPSFTWIKVDIDTSNEPSARAGHTCNARDGQMVVVGGYIGQSDNCDGSGIYNFNASSLKWQDSFEAADHPEDLDPENNILANSNGYRVPDIVQSVVGGSSDGGATATTPASGPATGGPFLTGTAPVFTVTAPGSTATVSNTSPGSTTPTSSGAPKGALIAAGIIAGIAGLAACYLGFCAWVYRRQVDAYKRHIAVVNRYSGQEGLSFTGATGLRDKLRKHRRGSSSMTEPEQFGWVGQNLNEPKWMSTSDEPTPGSRSGSGIQPRRSEDRNNPFSPYYDTSLGSGSGVAGVGRMKSSATRSTASGSSTDGLLDGREPSYFSVVMGPRRALRVVNGMDQPAKE